MGDMCNDKIEPNAKKLEAEQLFEIQIQLGIDFNEGKEAAVDRLLKMEDRDRQKMEECQEQQGSQ
jgi:hypothetical protein